MASYPEIQRKAQEEVDRVTGGQRLPEFDDRIHMPYTQAIVREVLRWRPLFPLGLPHASMEDDVYNGYFIPKGEFLFRFVIVNRSRIYGNTFKGGIVYANVW